ncbi:MAG: hypothetical protein QOC70_2405 [Verrucomicrobiota bacterium]
MCGKQTTIDPEGSPVCASSTHVPGKASVAKRPQLATAVSESKTRMRLRESPGLAGMGSNRSQNARGRGRRPSRPGRLPYSQPLAGSLYCLIVVEENAPGTEFDINEFPWNELIVPPFSDTPFAFCAIMLSETFSVEPLLAWRPFDE